MTVTFIEPGGDADLGVALWDASAQTNPALSTTTMHAYHQRSLKYVSGSATSVGKHNVWSDAGGRASFYADFSALPGATASIMDVLGSSYGTGIIVLRLTTGGNLQLASSGVQLGSTGTATFSTNTWRRISVAFTITNTTTFTIKVWVDGSLDINTSNSGTLAGTGSADIILGNISADASMTMFSSDHYIDNSSALTDPGNIWVTAKRPYSNGTSNQFTTQIGTGSSGYGSGHAPQVNERPVSNSDGWSISTTTVQTEEYNIEPANTGDTDISAATIVDYMGWIRAHEASTANSPVTHIIVNGVTTTKTLTTSDAYYEQMAGSSTYPAGTGSDIGMDGQYTTTAHLFSLTECGIVVAYIPSSAGPVLLQDTTNGSSSSSSTVAKLTSNDTAGSLLVVGVYYSDPANFVTSVTDTEGNTYHLACDETGATTNNSFSLYYASGIVGGTANQITVNFTSAIANCVIVREYSDIVPSSPLDQTAVAQLSNTTTISSGATAATAQAAELVIGMVSANIISRVSGPSSGFSNFRSLNAPTLNPGLGMESLVTAAAGAQTATFAAGSAVFGAAGAATFKIPSGGTPTTGQFFPFF